MVPDNVLLDASGSRRCRACATAKNAARWATTKRDSVLLARKKESDRASFARHRDRRLASSQRRYQQLRTDDEAWSREQARRRVYREQVIKPSGKGKIYRQRYLKRLKAEEPAKYDLTIGARSRAMGRKIGFAGRRRVAEMLRKGEINLSGYSPLQRQRLTNYVGRLALANGLVSTDQFDPFLFTDEGRRRIFERDGYQCKLCGTPLGYADAHLDHRKPVARGGSHLAENLQTLCGPCNRRKHASESV
jgi:hypothetical protein